MDVLGYICFWLNVVWMDEKQNGSGLNYSLGGLLVISDGSGTAANPVGEDIAYLSETALLLFRSFSLLAFRIVFRWVVFLLKGFLFLRFCFGFYSFGLILFLSSFDFTLFQL